MYWEFHEGGFYQAVRWGRWKANREGLRGDLELYDIERDLGEEINIAGQHPDIIARIQEYLRTARTDSYEYQIQGRSLRSQRQHRIDGRRARRGYAGG